MSDLIIFLVVFSSTVLLFLLLFVAKLIFDAMKSHQDCRKQIVTEQLRPASRLSLHSNSQITHNNNNNRSLSSECGDSLHSGSLKRKSSPTNSSNSKTASLDSAVWTTSSGSNSLNSKTRRNNHQNLKVLPITPAQEARIHQPTPTINSNPHHIISNLESITDPMNREPYNTVQIVEQTNCKVHPFRITYCTKV